MFKRIAAIAFIFFCTALAWAILGTTIFARTYSSRPGLEQKVIGSWGAPQEQKPPVACGREKVNRLVSTTENGKSTTKVVEQTVSHTLALESSRVQAALGLEHRQKGLLWYSTYRVAFGGTYVFRNAAQEEKPVTFTLDLPGQTAIYDDLEFRVDGIAVPVSTSEGKVSASRLVPAGGTATLETGYRSQGLDTWRYNFGRDVSQVRDFKLAMTTNFRDIDFPANTLSPTSKRQTPDGWELTWAYRNLVSGLQIGMAMPEHLQPGPLAGEISYFAPVSLLFFFFLMFIVTTLRRIDLHPMNYFFLACAFFAFHLLLAYLVDHVTIHTAVAICSAVSVFLVVSYLRLVTGPRFAAVEAGLAQLIYLVGFSYAFFWKGYTGLAVTAGAIVTLFVVMQMTGRIRWSERFARPGAAANVPYPA